MNRTLLFRRTRLSPVRRCLGGVILGLCLLMMIHVWLLEAFVVPTGSMAPALAGHHRVGECPCCGFTVRVGRHAEDADGGGAACYQDTTCPNCGHGPVPLGQVPEATGDHILVNKSVYLFRRPRRWEVIVFQLFGKIFVKRLIGLPGEWLTIVDGDIFADDRLVRKSLDEFKKVRILVFDNEFLPQPHGGSYRWEYQAEPEAPARDASNPALAHRAQTWRADKQLFLDGSHDAGQPCWLSYRNFSMKTGKDETIHDEYAYNAGCVRGQEPVHDFMVECDLEVIRGTGSILLGISDGKDTLVARLPVGPARSAGLYQQSGGELPPRPLDEPALVHANVGMRPGRTYHLELALVDRRVTMNVDGKELVTPVDLPTTGKRPAVDRPVAFGVQGAAAIFHKVRLYRDVHYTQAGRNGVHGKVVRLGPDQYFVMGDNSPNSEDSRFWPNHGAVPAANIMGQAFVVHFPSRIVSGTRWGRSWQCQVPDWTRVRWLR